MGLVLGLIALAVWLALTVKRTGALTVSVMFLGTCVMSVVFMYLYFRM